MTNIIKWVVEEKLPDGHVSFLQEYETFDEAVQVYNQLKEESSDTLLSIQKTEKKLLLD